MPGDGGREIGDNLFLAATGHKRIGWFVNTKINTSVATRSEISLFVVKSVQA
jgi:hypothetical protein